MRQAELYEKVGRNLLARRKEMQRSQTDVANAANISRPSLANIEKGRQALTLHQIYKLAGALDLHDARDLLPIGITAVNKQKDSQPLRINPSSSKLNNRQRSEVERIIKASGQKR